MIPVMKIKFSVFIAIAALIAIAGCVKETYDIDKLSKEAHLIPGFGISVVKGTITLSDVIEKNDTIVFDGDTVFIDDENVITFVYRKDSVISFNLKDYYNLDEMVSYEESFEVGEMSLGSFRDTIMFSLDEISQKFPAGVRTALIPLDKQTGDFPAFPEVTLEEKTYGPFSNFEYATFSEGIIEVDITNNLPIEVTGLIIQLYNTAGPTPIGDPLTYLSIGPGETLSDSVNLENTTIGNEISAVVTLGDNDGGEDVYIDLDNENLEIIMAARDMKIMSGMVLIPSQEIISINETDTINFDPGEDIQIDEIKILTGNLTYNINAMVPIAASLSIALPTSSQDGNTIKKTIEVEPNSIINDSISLDNSVINLGTYASQPYNMLPVNYSVEASSAGVMVEFNSTDEVSVKFDMHNPKIDYVKGYFGQYGDTIESDTIDLEIEDILSNISGSYLISSPSVQLNYSNSFAIPVEIDLDAVGYKEDDSVDIDLDPVPLSYPSAPAERDKQGVFTIDKNNSNLPGIISMPPEKIRFGGSAVMNPDGNTGTRDNYIFGDSRFLGDLEVEIPVELRLNNLHFADTVDNPLHDEDFSDSPIDPEDIESLKILLDIDNGFPLGISLSVSLYDSTANTVRSTLNAADILEPAPVDANGRVSAPAECYTEIELTNDFWKWIKDADKIIFSITLVTTDGGIKDVKIYSDYTLDYKAALFVKPDLKFSFD
jgi:hypothetical protein